MKNSINKERKTEIMTNMRKNKEGQNETKKQAEASIKGKEIQTGRKTEKRHNARTRKKAINKERKKDRKAET